MLAHKQPSDIQKLAFWSYLHNKQQPPPERTIRRGLLALFRTLLLLVVLAVVRGVHLLCGAGALLCHLDLGQVALAAAHVVAALADITGHADVFHVYHLSAPSLPRVQRVYAGKISQPALLRAWP